MEKDTTAKRLPRTNNDAQLADEFKNLFIRKINRLNETFNTAAGLDDSLQPDFLLGELNNFHKVSIADILEIYLEDPLGLKISPAL